MCAPYPITVIGYLQVPSLLIGPYFQVPRVDQPNTIWPPTWPQFFVLWWAMHDVSSPRLAYHAGRISGRQILTLDWRLARTMGFSMARAFTPWPQGCLNSPDLPCGWDFCFFPTQGARSACWTFPCVSSAFLGLTVVPSPLAWFLMFFLPFSPSNIISFITWCFSCTNCTEEASNLLP